MLSEIIESSQGSASAVAFEAAVLELLQREIGFDVAYFTVKGRESRPTVMAIESPLVERAVALGEVYLQELAPVKRVALSARGVAVDTQVLGLARLRETRYYRELSASAGVQHSLMAYVPWRGQVAAALMLGRSGAFAEREMRRVESSLTAIGVGRAAFGLPWVSEPLRGAVRPSVLSRFGVCASRPLASVPTPSGKLVVRDRGGYREMVAVQSGSELVWTRAALQDPGESGWPYLDLFHVAAALAARRERALFIGCGGGVALRQFASSYPGIDLDVVEREPAVVELARSWYDLDAIPGLTVHVADGIDFVTRAPASTWDVAVIDAYDTSELATGFARRGFFAKLRRILRPGGAMGINLIGALDGSGPLPSVVRSARAELHDVRVVPVMVADEAYSPHAPRNIVVVATKP